MLLVPLGYWFLPKSWMVIALSAGLVTALAVEWARFNTIRFAGWFYKITGPLLRPHEQNRLTGATCMILGSLTAVILFQRWIAMASLLLVIISDALAGMVGRKWGRVHLFGNLTLEGSLAFVVSGIMIILMIPGSNVTAGIAGVLVILILDGIRKNVDDNLIIPVVSGIVMEAFVRFLP